MQTFAEMPSSKHENELNTMLLHHHLAQQQQQQQAANRRKQSTPFRLNEDAVTQPKHMNSISASPEMKNETSDIGVSASANQGHEDSQQSQRSLQPLEGEEEDSGGSLTDEEENGGSGSKSAMDMKLQDSIQQLSSVLGLAMTAVSGGAHPSALFLQTAANKTAGLDSLLGLNQQEQSIGQPPEAPASSDSSLSGTQPVPSNTKPSGTKGDEDYCDICQKRVCNKYYLKKHKADVHGIFNPPGSGDALEDGMSLVPAQQSPNFSLLASHPGMAANLHGHGTFLTGLQSLMSLGSSPGTPVELLRQKLPHLANSMAAQFSSGSSVPPSAGIFPNNPGLPFPLPSSTAGPGHTLPFPLLHSSQTLNPLAAAMYFSSLASPFAGLLKSSPTSTALAPPTNNNLVTNPCNSTPPSSISATVAGVLPPSAGNLLIRPPLGLEEDKSAISNLSNQSNSFCSKCQHDFGFPYLLKTHQALFHPQDMLAASHKVGFSVTSLSNSVTATSIQETTPTCTVPSLPSLPVPSSVMSADLATYRGHLEQKMNSSALLQSFQETHQPPNSTLPSAEVAYIDSFRNNMMAAKLADRVTCDVCHKELCNKYFLKTHKMKVHGIPITSSSGTNDNAGQTQEWPTSPPDMMSASGISCIMDDICNNKMQKRQSEEVKPITTTMDFPSAMSVVNTTQKQEDVDKLSLTLSGVVEAAAAFVNTTSVASIPMSNNGAFFFDANSTNSSSAFVNMASTAQGSPDSKSLSGKQVVPTSGARDSSSGSSNHMRVMCDICGKSICNKYFLRTHKRKRHGVCEDLNGMPILPQTTGIPPSPSQMAATTPGENPFFNNSASTLGGLPNFPGFRFHPAAASGAPGVLNNTPLPFSNSTNSISTPLSRAANIFHSPIFATSLQQDKPDPTAFLQRKEVHTLPPYQQQENAAPSSPEAMDFTIHQSKQDSPPQEVDIQTNNFPPNLKVKELDSPFLPVPSTTSGANEFSDSTSSLEPLNLSKTTSSQSTGGITATHSDGHDSCKQRKRTSTQLRPDWSSSTLSRLRKLCMNLRANRTAKRSVPGVIHRTRCPLCYQSVVRSKRGLVEHLHLAH